MRTPFLYITYDGLLDSLGESQILPYIRGLARKGYQITIVSCEKKKRRYRIPILQKYLKQENIHWIPVNYYTGPVGVSTLTNLFAMWNRVYKYITKQEVQAVHCRSYLPAIIGSRLKTKKGIPHLFDMRGFWPDERVEGGLWNLKNPVYWLIYRYFKKMENRFIRESSHIVSLTETGRDDLMQRKAWLDKKAPVTVIPCCVDTDHFKASKNTDSIHAWKTKLHIPTEAFVLGYLGSLGTWYMLDEMLDFFKALKQIRPDAVFVFFSPDAPAGLRKKTEDRGLNPEDVIITYVQRDDLPQAIHVFDLSVFFIRPTYSKKASSPTKMGELLSAGTPFFTNTGVGDVDAVYREAFDMDPIPAFEEEEYRKALQHLDNIMSVPGARLHETAERHFSLERGIMAYDSIYRSLLTLDE